MVIGVCFKILPDFEDVDPAEWENPQQLEFGYVKKMYGCFDEAALETALRLRDQLQAAGETAVTAAVTVGAPESAAAEGLLRSLFAAGFDHVVTIPGTAEFEPKHTARILAGYFRENPADLIFCGRMVGPGDSGMVPLHLARELGCDLYPEVTTAAWNAEDASVVVTCREGNTLCRRQIAGNAVCTLGDAEAAYLRLFPLRARMAARNREFTHWQGMERENAPEVVLLAEKKETVPCRFLSRDTAAREVLEILKGADDT